MTQRIYLSPPDVGATERALLLDAFDSGWIAPLGPHVDDFEREFARTVGVPYAVALSSGTAALHLGLQILGVGRRDEVITSTLTFAATANAICYQGASPVFLDVSTRHLDAGSGSARGRARGAGAQQPAGRGRGRRRSLRTVRRIRANRSAVRPLRRPAHRGCGRGPRRDLRLAQSRRLRGLRGVLVQRQQDHHDQRRRHAGVEQPRDRRAGASSLHPGAPAGRPLRARRRRLQLPPEQPARRGRPRAARTARRAKLRAAATSTRSTARRSRTGPESRSCPKRHTAGRTPG